MTTDFDDADLERSLTRHGDEFRNGLAAPDLTAMVQHAIVADRPNHRWAWPLLAAVLLLAIPLVTVLALHRGTGSHRAPAATTSTDPSLELLGYVPWRDPVLQPDGRTIVVAVVIDATPSYCLDDGDPVLKPVVTENAGSVRIEVDGYRHIPESTSSAPPGAQVVCSAVGHLPVALSVSLDSALAGRKVTGPDGVALTVTDAAGFLTPSSLPSGFTGNGLVSVGEGIVGNNLPHLTYGHDQDVLAVLRGAPGYETPHVVSSGTVRGQPAEVVQDGSWNDNVCATWTENGQPWSVCELSARTQPLSPAELLTFANSLR